MLLWFILMMVFGLEISMLYLHQFCRFLLIYFGGNYINLKSDLVSKLRELKEEQSHVSMQHEFAKYSKLQRKINAATDKLNEVKQNDNSNFTRLLWKMRIILYLCYGVIMFVIVYSYKQEPVTILPVTWFPFVNILLKLPTAVEGGIGIPVWIVICRQVSRSLLNKN